MIKSSQKNLLACFFVYTVYVLILGHYLFTSGESILIEESFKDKEFIESFLVGQSIFFVLNFIIYSSLIFNLDNAFVSYKHFVPFNISSLKLISKEFFYVLGNRYYQFHLLIYLILMGVSFDHKSSFIFLLWISFCLLFQVLGLFTFILLRIFFNHNEQGKKNFISIVYFTVSLLSLVIITGNEYFLFPLYPIIKLPFASFISVNNVTIFFSVLMLISGAVMVVYKFKKRVRFD